MADGTNFVQPSIPKFDGFYDHWAMLMENLLRSKEYWSLVESGVPTLPDEATQEQIKLVKDSKLKDLKVKNYLFQAIDRGIIETILNKDTAKDIWDSMRLKYQGSTKVKRAQLQALRREFEVLAMKEGESVDEYFARTLAIVNKMKAQGEKMQETVIVQKILRSMTTKFNYVVCSIEESNDVGTLTIDELQSSLLVHEKRMRGYKEEEQALKVTNAAKSPGRGKGRSGTRGGRGRGRQSFNKETVECYKCHKLGHFQYECPNWEKNANYVESNEEEEMLLMAQFDSEGKSGKVWFLDSGCSNHMCGNKEWFFGLDESFRFSVRLGDNSTMMVMGKGNIKLRIDGLIQVITEVFYIPNLKNNLLSIGQLQQKGLTIIFQKDICKVYHEEKGMIMQSEMSSNRMFAVMATVMSPTCFKTVSEDSSYLWHCRYGHLSLKGLRLLAQKEMVRGLPMLNDCSRVCGGCMAGKQHRDSFPKKSSWRAS